MRFDFSNSRFMLAEASRDRRPRGGAVWFAPELRRVERVHVGDGQAVAALYQLSPGTPGGMVDLAYLVIERDGSHTVYEVPSSDCGLIQVPGATWTEQQLVPEEPEPEPEPAPATVKLLLTDSEGWAGLYGEGDEAKLSRAMQAAQLEGEPLFTRAWLVLPNGVVVPAATVGAMTPFDEEDYATASVVFKLESSSPFYTSAMAGAHDVEFRVSWRVDGRS